MEPVPVLILDAMGALLQQYAVYGVLSWRQHGMQAIFRIELPYFTP
jgi:hypothetical protein